MEICIAVFVVTITIEIANKILTVVKSEIAIYLHIHNKVILCVLAQPSIDSE